MMDGVMRISYPKFVIQHIQLCLYFPTRSIIQLLQLDIRLNGFQLFYQRVQNGNIPKLFVVHSVLPILASAIRALPAKYIF